MIFRNYGCSQEIKDLDERKMWLDWLGEYGDFLNQKTSSEKKTREWLEGLIQKIIVRPVYAKDREGKNEVQKGHTFTLVFKMKIVDDTLNYVDENNKKLGYELSHGKQRKKSSVVDFMTGRGMNKKKALVERQLEKSNPNPSVTVEQVRLDNTFRMERIQIIFFMKFPRGSTTFFQNKIQHDIQKNN